MFRETVLFSREQFLVIVSLVIELFATPLSYEKMRVLEKHCANHKISQISGKGIDRIKKLLVWQKRHNEYADDG